MHYCIKMSAGIISNGIMLTMTLSGVFFISLIHILSPNRTWRSLFTKSLRANSKTPYFHALIGLLYLMWLFIGFVSTAMLIYHKSPLYLPLTQHEQFFFYFDISLGVLGIILTLTAAKDFPHKNIKNFASGTLDQHATVTQGEMIEHSFYQGINLVQIIYIHLLSYATNPFDKAALCLAATAPWLFRNKFPIHSFSSNYSPMNKDPKNTLIIKVLYRIKKYQYVFYKHFLLHGLNISLALRRGIDSGDSPAVCISPVFRVYWLLLNTAYTMEFFLQTLVKKGHLQQHSMLRMQKLLMLVSSAAAAGSLFCSMNLILLICLFPFQSIGGVLWEQVRLTPALLSLVLNFLWRGRDMQHTATILAASLFIDSF